MRLPNRRVLGPLAAVLLATAPALGDEIYLKGGGRVSGRIVERTATRVAIETGPGRVTLPLTRVERIVEGRSTIEAFAEQAADLAAGDVAGWADLARRAEQLGESSVVSIFIVSVESLDPVGDPQQAHQVMKRRFVGIGIEGAIPDAANDRLT